MVNARRCLAAAIAATAVTTCVATSAGARPSRMSVHTASAKTTYAVLGQPALADRSYSSRCSGSRAQFERHDFGGGFSTLGPTGIAIGPKHRLYVADDGGQRVLSWPNADALKRCERADRVIANHQLEGPEAVTVDRSGTVYVADTLDHTVKIFRPVGGGATYRLAATLGHSGQPGSDDTSMDYPRG